MNTRDRMEQDSTEPAGDAQRATDAQRPAGEETHDADRMAHRPLRRRSPWLDYGVTLLVALVIAVLVKTFLVQPFFIPSESMVPTLEKNDKIIVSKLTPGVFPLRRGDVIVFEDPANWIPEGSVPHGNRYRFLKALSYVGLSPDPSQEHLVKRLIGLPGDRVECREQGGPLRVNGVKIDEPYVNGGNPPCQWRFDVTVPAGDVWVMGDNRGSSADSAYHYVQRQEAFVPEDRITGKAVAVMWPLNRWATLSDGEKAFAAVPAHP